MDVQNFCYWLNGFVELTGGKTPTDQQWASIVAHLDLVFNKEVAYSPERQLAIHEPEPEPDVVKSCGPSEPKPIEVDVSSGITDYIKKMNEAVEEHNRQTRQREAEKQWDYTKIFPQQHPPMYPPIYPQYPTPGIGWPGMDPYFTPTVIC